MAFCFFDDGAAMFDATPIENLFITEYMYDTPGPMLKVYLYARMLALHPELGGSAADMAMALRLTEDEVAEAFRYWERRDLMVRKSDNPPTYALRPLRGQGEGGSEALTREIYANRDFNNRLQKLFENVLIQQHDLNKAADWVNLLHFDKDAVVCMLEYGKELTRSKHPKPPTVFKKVDNFAEEWSKRGIRTREEVERAIAEEKGSLPLTREVLKKLGIARQPSDAELESVRTWTDDWGYTREQILDACGETVSARNPSVGYLNAILENRRDEYSRHYEAVSAVLRELNPQSAQPAPDQLKRYAALIDVGYAPELIQLAAVQCHRRNKYTFEDLEWRLNLWREEDLTTPEAVDAYTRQMAALSRQLREVFRRAGYDDRRPSPGELKTYGAWRDAYSEDVIEFAAECAKNAGGSMAYIQRLLEQWAADGAVTVEDAKARHAAWKAAGGDADRAASASAATNYTQREYKEEDFGDDFFVDLSQYQKEDSL